MGQGVTGGDFWTFMIPLVGHLWGRRDHSHWDVGFLCLEWGMGEVMGGSLGREVGEGYWRKVIIREVSGELYWEKKGNYWERKVGYWGRMWGILRKK